MANQEPSSSGMFDDKLKGLVIDYPEAVVRIASLRVDQVQYFLFGLVELYPFDMKAPGSWTAGKQPWSVPGRSGWSCGFSASRVPTERALNWYAQVAAGKVNIAPENPTPVWAMSPNLAPEPAWGRFATSVEAPFAFCWHDGPRVHRLVPMRRPRRAIHELSAIEPARNWLRDNLGFDLFQYNEWLCAAALLAPDPICASFELFPCARTVAGSETLAIHLTPRRTAQHTADLKTLTVYVAERRSQAWTDFRAVAVTQDGFAALEMPQPTAEIGWALVCRDRGLLRTSEPAPWLNQTKIDMALSGAIVEVHVPPGGRRKPFQSYKVPQYSSSQISTIGDPVDDRGHARLLRLARRRHARERIVSAPQYVFGLCSAATQPSQATVDKKRKEAQEYVVSLISRARRRLIFVDPYFGPREMRLFALRNSHQEVVPRILTGLPSLKMLTGNVLGFQIQQGFQFARDLKYLEKQMGVRTPIVRVMPGQDQPAIHDRLLVVDDEVWHCGPSFNEIGERLGLITRLPNPIELRVMVARVWLRSELLVDMLPTQEGAP
ncbi:VPA1262 family N-terminal domain-containing protein [Rhodopseudomonas parapalustris]